MRCHARTAGSPRAAWPQKWPAPLGSPLPSASVFALPGSAALIVGEDASGLSHAVRLDAKGITEIALKVGRKRARALVLPTGEIAVAGGATTIEGLAP